ncbi:MAG TPA: serine/threonine-protein kinase PknK, partial [Coleofasciculaceae cyanobacterium]
MNHAIAGYNLLETLYEGAVTCVYRAEKKFANELNSTAVILKTLRAEYPTLEELARLKHEYQILQALEIEKSIKPLALENHLNKWVLVLSDFSGEPLANVIAARPFEIDSFLKVAIHLAAVLAQLHEHHLIHKDIKPHNILVNQTTCEVRIIDFGISSRFSRENPIVGNPNLLEGTLAYMSPEQTGRMNRSVDYRTDFYSLGATFYEMLTGQLLFPATDPLELIHCHIAKIPVPPHRVNPRVPEAVSAIVMKLLAKTAEDRYQSALGLKEDLETCLQMLQTSGQITAFQVGDLDLFSQFSIPQKLYGRDREVGLLMAAFQRVSAGNTELMLVSGFSGVGKSSLVNEVHKPIVGARGYFISGKFNQFQRNVPYSAIIAAFQALVKQLLTESAAQLAQWQEKLLVALGSNAQVIIDVVPEVEWVIGKQPAVLELGATEAQNRFNLTFQNFIRVFCSPEHPLVFFLDDLQWADSATLKLLEVILSDAAIGYLLLIGAYRDHEVSSRHPFMITLELLRTKAVAIEEIALVPLALEDITQLIADALHSDAMTVQPLAELVIQKTSGNPFFVNQFLKTLHQENLLTFRLASQDNQAGWHWDIAQIEAMGITDNVVELMIRKLQKLPDSTQQVLQLAACVGNTFDLRTLALIYKRSPAAAYQNLLSAIEEGLILPISELKVTPEDINEVHQVSLEFKFLHDRVQQAAYALIDESSKHITHLQIGRLLWHNTVPETLSDKIFEIVDHLNLGIALITQESERSEIAHLNLMAGRKAKTAAAYAAATKYLQAGLAVLVEESWDSQYELTLALHEEIAESAFLSGDFDEMNHFIQVVQDRATSLLDKTKVYEVQIQACMRQNKLREAVNTALQVLKLFEVKFPDQPSASDVGQGLQETAAILSGKKTSDLIDLPA